MHAELCKYVAKSEGHGRRIWIVENSSDGHDDKPTLGTSSRAAPSSQLLRSLLRRRARQLGAHRVIVRRPWRSTAPSPGRRSCPHRSHLPVTWSGSGVVRRFGGGSGIAASSLFDEDDAPTVDSPPPASARCPPVGVAAFGSWASAACSVAGSTTGRGSPALSSVSGQVGRPSGGSGCRRRRGGRVRGGRFSCHQRTASRWMGGRVPWRRTASPGYIWRSVLAGANSSRWMVSDDAAPVVAVAAEQGGYVAGGAPVG